MNHRPVDRPADMIQIVFPFGTEDLFDVVRFHEIRVLLVVGKNGFNQEGIFDANLSLNDSYFSLKSDDKRFSPIFARSGCG